MVHRHPRDIEQLVERQVRRWEAESAARRQAAAQALYWPVITISREFGARGAAIAQTIGGRLGFEVWDRQILKQVAERGDVSLAVVDSLDEHGRDSVTAWWSAFVERANVTRSSYLRHLGQAVRAIGTHGTAVIIGRGANYLLDPTHALRVRVVRPLDDRIDDVAQRLGLDRLAAAKEVAQRDDDRRQYVRKHFRRDIDDPLAYDLVLNTGTVSLEGASDIILSAYRARFGALPV